MSETHNQSKVTPTRLLMLSSTDTLHISHYQIITPFSYHHKSELASALPSPPHARSHWLKLNQPALPDLENTLLTPLHRSSSPTSFLAFSPLRRYFIHLSLIYTSNLLVIGWYFAWFRSISTHNGWLMVGCLLLCLIFFFFFWCLGFRFFRLGVFVSSTAFGIGVHLRQRVISARESQVHTVKEHPESLAATKMDNWARQRASSGTSGDYCALSCKEEKTMNENC